MTYNIDNNQGGQIQVEIDETQWTAEEIAAYREHKAELEMMDDEETQWDQPGEYEFSFQEEADAAYWASRGC